MRASRNFFTHTHTHTHTFTHTRPSAASETPIPVSRLAGGARHSRHVPRLHPFAVLAPGCRSLQHGGPRVPVFRLAEDGLRAACSLLVRVAPLTCRLASSDLPALQGRLPRLPRPVKTRRRADQPTGPRSACRPACVACRYQGRRRAAALETAGSTLFGRQVRYPYQWNRQYATQTHSQCTSL